MTMTEPPSMTSVPCKHCGMSVHYQPRIRGWIADENNRWECSRSLDGSHEPIEFPPLKTR